MTLTRHRRLLRNGFAGPTARVVVVCAAALACLPAHAASLTLNVGSKRFTESYILGEIITQLAASANEAGAVHQRGLGNTAIVLSALQTGRIDVYPEYTGTIAREILKLDSVPPLPELNARLAAMGLAAAVPLGFNNTYALAMRGDDARTRGITRLSDLGGHADLRFGLSQEFLGRADGWPGLALAYAPSWPARAMPRGLDHGLAYEAITHRQVDVIDIYSTDAKLEKYGLTVLADDRNYFPRYDAVLLYRVDLPARLPRTWARLAQLAGRIDDASMRRLNAAAELEGKEFSAVASDWLAQLLAPLNLPASVGTVVAGDRGGAAATDGDAEAARASARAGLWQRLFAPDFGRLAFEHVVLVFSALAASVALGVPLGVLAARRRVLAGAVLGLVGVIQTVPALALLAFLIPLTGRIGAVPAFIALALYALLPIVRNTHAGLTQIPAGLQDAARAFALPAQLVLRKIELPLAAPTIYAGIKTSAVINVGTATIAAFVGAGGFGERIVTGLALNDHAALLAGAIPAAALALLIEGAFAYGERWAIPAGLRQGRTR